MRVRGSGWVAAWGLVLAGCGGGGGGSPAPVVTQPVEPPLSSQCLSGSVARLELPSAAQVGRNSELILQACGGALLSEVRWTQAAGPVLMPMSMRSQALSVEPKEAGSYRFALSYQSADGAVHSGQAEFNVQGTSEPGLLVRGEPSAYSNANLSLRAWAPGLSQAERDGASVQWSVVDGPAATFTEAKGWRMLLKAPAVTQDSVLRLRATAMLADGRSLNQTFSLLVQAPPQQAGSDALFKASDPVSRVYPYVSRSPYAQALRDCVYSPALNTTNTCTLGRLPLLGQETQGALPTVEQVMQRVLVSNDWMGEVFEQFLRTQDTHGDFRRLLNATTAVVIGGRVRPSFYWSATGAIYLDGANFWLTPEQRDTLSEAPDPRSDYGSALHYATPWRYVLNNQYAAGLYPVAERKTRDISSLVYALGPLLYHELTHAADAVPPRLHQQLRSDLRVWQSSPALTTRQDLAQRYPFFSQEMVALGRVQFFGVEATPAQVAYQPSDIVRFFSQDRVNDDYAYSMPEGASVSAEDPAMLVEEAMMQLRYGVLRDFAISHALPAGGSSADLVLSWGQRGRIGEPAIRPRVTLVLEQVMPWLGAGFADRLAAPLALKPGLTWGQNLDLAAMAANRARPLTAQERLIEAEQASQRSGERARRAQAQHWREGVAGWRQ